MARRSHREPVRNTPLLASAYGALRGSICIRSAKCPANCDEPKCRVAMMVGMNDGRRVTAGAVRFREGVSGSGQGWAGVKGLEGRTCAPGTLCASVALEKVTLSHAQGPPDFLVMRRSHQYRPHDCRADSASSGALLHRCAPLGA